MEQKVGLLEQLGEEQKALEALRGLVKASAELPEGQRDAAKLALAKARLEKAERAAEGAP